MRPCSYALLALSLGAGVVLGSPTAASAEQDASLSAAERLLLDLNAKVTGILEESETLAKRTKGCSIFNASIRRDWYAAAPMKDAHEKESNADQQNRALMTKAERRDYIQAAKCLYEAPSKLHAADPQTYPGLRSRYDDFVAVHLEQTLSIHGTVSRRLTSKCPTHD